MIALFLRSRVAVVDVVLAAWEIPDVPKLAPVDDPLIKTVL
jgi:hypothetical protein